MESRPPTALAPAPLGCAAAKVTGQCLIAERRLEIALALPRCWTLRRR